MRGYTVEENNEIRTQPLFVECSVTEAAGSQLSIGYEGFQGILITMSLSANKIEGTLELNLDEVVTDLTYPVASPVEA
jgi:hypothetical protein